MLVNDQCGAIKFIKQLAQRDTTKEHCALAVANRSKSGKQFNLIDYCMIEDVGGMTSESISTIPREVSYLLLNTCKKQGNVPIILHSHIFGYEYSEPLEFSPQDMEYIKKFTQYAAELKQITYCIFIVTNGRDTVYCCVNLMNCDYCFEEELNNE